ncbi:MULTISPECIES: DUF6069 family protein [unclassified Streptomyces]|uniref:DUF6069 family protein n=1 Tax=unclassified Streptomyces TaxID=2593676 RepID=UPI002E17524A|nr:MULTISPECIES: DUF6069 family protein [unclassified Streptomyces]
MEPQKSPYGQPYGQYEQYQQYGQPQGQPEPAYAPEPQPRLDAGKLWAGGVMTAVIAALTAVVALLLVRGVLDIPVFAPAGDGLMNIATTGTLAMGAAVTALLATALLNLLIVATPRPGSFFSWIIGLATAVMVLLPFTTSLTWEAKFGTAGVYLVIGIAIGSLLSAVGRGAIRRF